MDVAVSQKDTEVFELAGHRSYIRSMAQHQGRQSAVFWRQQRDMRIQGIITEWDDVDEDMAGKGEQFVKRSSMSADKHEEDEFEGEDHFQKLASQMHSSAFVESTEVAGSKKKSVSMVHEVEIVQQTFKRNKEQRMKRLSRMCHRRRKTERRFLDAQMDLDLDDGENLDAGGARRRFTTLPPKDQHGFRRVFAEYDKDGSNTLDRSELKHCLADLGLRGKNEEERAEINKIISEGSSGEVGFYEFSLQLVPKVRAKLHELQRERLRHIFDHADEDKSNMLSTDEALNILRLMGINPSDELLFEVIQDVVPKTNQQSATAFDQTWIRTKDVLDFTSFERLIRTLQERHERMQVERFKMISEREGFSEHDQKRWRHELVNLYDCFHRYDLDHSGTLEGEEVHQVVRENNLLPHNHAEKEGLEVAITETQRLDGQFGFREFLLLIKRLRSLQRQKLHRLFAKFDKDGSGLLSLTEVMTVLYEFGIQARNKSEQHEIRALLEEADEDASGELDFEEFVLLHQRVSDKMKAMQKEADRQLGLKLGFAETDIKDFREAFELLDVDGMGDLDMPAIRTAIEGLNANMRPEELGQIFDTLHVDRKKGTVDFQTFLHLMRMIEDKQGLFTSE